MIDVTTGSIQVEATGNEPLATDSSGCIVGARTAVGFDLLSSDGVQQVQTDDALLALSLDGRSVVAERGTRLLLVDPAADTDPEEPLDLGPRGRTVHFTQS